MIATATVTGVIGRFLPSRARSFPTPASGAATSSCASSTCRTEASTCPRHPKHRSSRRYAMAMTATVPSGLRFDHPSGHADKTTLARSANAHGRLPRQDEREASSLRHGAQMVLEIGWSAAQASGSRSACGRRDRRRRRPEISAPRSGRRGLPGGSRGAMEAPHCRSCPPDGRRDRRALRR
jgi:hypothetical protein